MKIKVIILFAALLILSWVSSISAMRSKPQEFQAHIEKAEDLEERGIFVDAIEEYETALTYKPNDVSILMRIANDYLQMEDEKKYVSTLKKAAEADQDGSRDALDTLMRYYIDADEQRKAVKYIKDLVARKPDIPYIQEWYIQLKGSYSELYCRYDEMYGMYNNRMIVKAGEYYSAIDAYGNRFLSDNYTELSPFSSDGFARTVNEKGNVVYIDTNGLTRVAPDAGYTNLGTLVNERIPGALNGQYGYLDATGDAVTDFQWDGITAFNKVGMANLRGKWAVIGSKGKERTEYIYDDVIVDALGIPCFQNRIFVRINGQVHLIDSKGNDISEQTFDDARTFTETGYAAVCKNEKWGFVDPSGNLVIDYQYDDALSFANGYASVCIADRWGYIDTENHLIIEAAFLEATSFSDEGSAAVRVEGENDTSDQWRLIRLDIKS